MVRLIKERLLIWWIKIKLALFHVDCMWCGKRIGYGCKHSSIWRMIFLCWAKEG